MKLPSVSDVENEQPPEEPVMSEDEIEEDFEPMRPDASDPKIDNGGLQLSLPPPPTATLVSPHGSVKTHSTRSGSMATVKLQRRARLAEKLREIFDLNGIEEVIAGASTAPEKAMPC